jgi:hypothetical protein
VLRGHAIQIPAFLAGIFVCVMEEYRPALLWQAGPYVPFAMRCDLVEPQNIMWRISGWVLRFCTAAG